MKTRRDVDESQPTPNPPSDFGCRKTETGDVAITRFRCQFASSCVVPAEIDGKAVVEIASNAFIGDSLRSLTLPDGVQTIADKTFANCKSLTSVKFPSRLQTIGDSAFSNCESLTSVEFPDGLQSIGSRAFYNCRSLKSLRIPNSLQTIGDSAFYGLQSLSRVDVSPNANFRLIDGVLFSKDGKTLVAYFENLRKESPKETYVVPNDVERICGGAFAECKALKDVAFPVGIQTVGLDAFSKCDALQSVTLPDSASQDVWKAARGFSIRLTPTPVPRLRAVDGVLFTVDGKTLLSCPRAKTELVVPDGVENIADRVFFALPSLRSLTFPNGLKKMEQSSCAHCEALETVAFGDGLPRVEPYTFYNCRALRSVTFGDGLQTVGYYAFENCRSLESLEFPDSLQVVEDAAFMNCVALRSVKFGLGSLAVQSAAFYNCKALETVVFPDGRRPILPGIFSPMFPLLEAGLQTVGHQAFYNCDALRSVTLPQSLTAIDKTAFGYRYHKKTIVETYPDGSFAYSYQLQNDRAHVDGFTIYGAPGSAAEKYAKENGFHFLPNVRR